MEEFYVVDWANDGPEFYRSEAEAYRATVKELIIREQFKPSCEQKAHAEQFINDLYSLVWNDYIKDLVYIYPATFKD